MIVLFTSDRRAALQEHLESGLIASGIEFEWHSVSQFSWAERLRWQLSEALKRPRETVIFCDAWDVMVNSPSKLRLLEETSFFKELVMSGDSDCWPAEDARPHFPQNGHWSYLCAGVFGGPGEEIAEAIAEGISLNFDFDIETSTDQMFWYRVALMSDYKPKIDYSTDFVMSLSKTPRHAFVVENGTVKNALNGNVPAFVHFNGVARQYYADVALEIMENQIG